MGNLPEAGQALLERLAGAVNSHDLDALEGCFAPRYRNETDLRAAPAAGGMNLIRAESAGAGQGDCYSRCSSLSVMEIRGYERGGPRPDQLVLWLLSDGGR